MININNLVNNDIGAWVEYSDGFKFEKGKIKSWNDKYIFVVYKCAGEWDRYKEYTGCATKPEDLNFINGTCVYCGHKINVYNSKQLITRQTICIACRDNL